MPGEQQEGSGWRRGRNGAAAGVRAAVCPWALGGATCMDRLFCRRWRDLHGSQGHYGGSLYRI